MSQKIKLLHITTVSGTFYLFRGQIAYMKARGYDIHALASPGEWAAKIRDQEKIPFHTVTMPRRITPFKDIVAIGQIWQQIRQINPLIVHSHTPKGGLLGTIAAWLARVPVRIYHIRGLPLMTATGYKRILLSWSEKVSCLLAHRVICVSHSIREVAINEGLCPQEKITVLCRGSSNGVDAADHFNPANLASDTRKEVRQKYGIPDDAIVVGFVGRIVPDKGIEELVIAWKILRGEFPNLHLLIVGNFDTQDSISTQAQEILQSDIRIHATGGKYHTDTPPLYAAMDLFTLPTYREGFPNVLLEAAAMALPVVATKIPGCIDAVEDGITGTLVPSHNGLALAQGISSYLVNSQLRQQHGLAGRDRVLREFCQEDIWNALHQEYLQILKLKGLPVPNSSHQMEGISL
ncbi:glycosyltransferase family 4 protein [Anabaena sp. FACHB-1237]|uniref:glycosyltransferase family 4 protein n=1 Tax=Anabaena sp. FACHB-1237 TaxID=2692769 RepID=UPI0016812513|nr:glycosyltransferase family 4 protein [Anabaena sp. FACHB-1237]MBD2138455.1 glycosyltransferase family 4 protein [Anabaena sp. FACHB-1237]